MPLSLLTPPDSPSSSASSDSEHNAAPAEGTAGSFPVPLSQHNLPLSTLDVETMREEAEENPRMEVEGKSDATRPAQDASSVGREPDGHDDESLDDGRDELSAAELAGDAASFAVDGLYMTQAPMLTEEQDHEPSSPPADAPRPSMPSTGSGSSSVARDVDLTLASQPFPSSQPYPSSMPPLSPGPPSPEGPGTPPKAEVEVDPVSLLLHVRDAAVQPTVDGLSERSDSPPAERDGEEKGDPASGYSEGAIRKRQQQRNAQLLRDRREAQRSRVLSPTASQQRSAAPLRPLRERDGRADSDGALAQGGSGKRQRVVRFAKEAEEVKEPEMARRSITEMTVECSDVESLRHETRAVYKAWSDDDYHFIISIARAGQLE